MKGGGFIILIFLFFCFIWGIAAVVAGIRKVFQPKQRPATDAPTPTSRQTTRVPTPATDSAASDNHGQDAAARTLSHLKRASDLHRDGTLSDEEFKQIKAKLIKGTPLDTSSS